jgi:hypothetical protein
MGEKFQLAARWKVRAVLLAEIRRLSSRKIKQKPVSRRRQGQPAGKRKGGFA